MSSETISHYRILSKLGAGGMGEVYLAEDSRLGRRVAIKFLPPELIADDRANKRLMKEARAAATLDHPNICSVYEIAEADGRSFIAMQYVEGETLEVRIKRKSLVLKESLHIASQVADALAEAHAHGIIHRDIKPSNIMITARGQAKVMDFGLAKLIEHQPTDSEAMTRSLLTEPGTVVGTLPYMSPEQLRGENLDARTDIFSFGTVLYEMVSGGQPFASGSAAATTSAILTRDPPPLARYSREVPAELERIVSKALRKDPAERYQTAQDLQIDLEQLEKQSEFAVNLGLERQTSSNQQTETEAAYPKLATSDSIAVLPFVNISADVETEYFCDGLAEELLNALAKIEDLRVAARTSAFSFKGKNDNVAEIGRALHVGSVLQGSVRRAGDRLRITVQLVNVSNGYHLWSERYDREMKDIFEVQDGITLAVVDALKIKLLGAEKAAALKRGTDNPEAYDSYLRGRFYWNKRTGDDINTAVRLFQEAIEKDSNYAIAYVGLADCYTTLSVYASTTASETLPQARAAAERALQLDDSLAEAHASLGNVYLRLALWEQAEKEFQRAISLNLNYPTAHHWYSEYFRVLGRFDEALREMKRAQELDPLSPVFGTMVGEIYQNLGNEDAAIKEWQRVAKLEPNFSLSHFFLGGAYARQQRYEQAIAESEKAVDLSGRGSVFLGGLGYAYARASKNSEALSIIRELEERFNNDSANGFDLAHIYAGLGDNEQAIAWLEKDFETGNTALASLVALAPVYEQLSNDSRYQDLLRRIRLNRS